MKYAVMILIGVAVVGFFGYSIFAVIRDWKAGKFRFQKKVKEDNSSDQFNI